MIPVIGDHIIKLGSGEKVAEKLDRLFVFYRQVLGKSGFNKYAALDVQFEGQVVAVKKEPSSPVDSIQLQKNIEELINKAMMQEIDENMLPGQMIMFTKDTVQLNTDAKADSVPAKTNPHPVASNQVKSDPSRTTRQSNPTEKPRSQSQQQTKPKAVMRRL